MSEPTDVQQPQQENPQAQADAPDAQAPQDGEQANKLKKKSKGKGKKGKPPISDAVRQMAQALHEENPRALQSMQRIVDIVGLEFTQQKYEESLKIEADGGMMTQDGSRRRTPGGVFFYLVKGSLDDEMREKVFPEMRYLKHRRPESPYPEMESWQERIDIFKSLEQKQLGKASDVIVKLNGRPQADSVERRKELVLFAMTQEVGSLGTMPRGIPEFPESFRNITYAIYMTEMHWDRVMESLQSDESDEMLIEGVAAWDTDLDAVAIFTTWASTERLEKKAKQKRKAEEQRQAAAEARKKGGAPAKQQGAAKGKPQPAAKPRPQKAAATSNVPPEVVKKVQELRKARQTLEQKLASAGGGVGATMTKKMLDNTTKQIEQLEKQYPDLK